VGRLCCGAAWFVGRLWCGRLVVGPPWLASSDDPRSTRRAADFGDAFGREREIVEQIWSVAVYDERFGQCESVNLTACRVVLIGGAILERGREPADNPYLFERHDETPSAIERATIHDRSV